MIPVKILFIAKRHYTNKDVIKDRFGRLFHIPYQLMKMGCDVRVIVVDYYGSKEESGTNSGLKYLSLPVRRFVKMVAKSKHCMALFKPDFIVASGDIPLGIAGLLSARGFGISFIYDVYDDYRAFPSGRIPMMKSIFGLVVKKADHLFCTNRELLKDIVADENSVTLVPNGVDTALFKNSSQAMARKKLNIDKPGPIIGYFGTIENNYGIDVLIQAVERLRHSMPDLSLLLAGKKNRPFRTTFPFVDYRGMVPQEMIPNFINACDVVTIPYIGSPQIDVSNPCKLSEYLACRVPIVSTRVSDIEDLMATVPDALCEPGNAEDMARAIRWQLEQKKIVTFPEMLTWKSITASLLNVLKRSNVSK